jgi:hypothetical protein
MENTYCELSSIMRMAFYFVCLDGVVDITHRDMDMIVLALTGS